MSAIKFSKKCHGLTTIGNEFILEHLGKLTESEVKLYLVLCCLYQNSLDSSLENIASIIGCKTVDIIYSMERLSSKKIINIKDMDNTGDMEMEFYDLAHELKTDKKEEKNYEESLSNIRSLMAEIEKIIGQPLNLSYVNLTSNLRDVYKFDDEMILYIYTLGKESNTISPLYIEGIARNFAENNISTKDDAVRENENKGLLFQSFREILNHAGLNSYEIPEFHKSHMKKWIEELKMPMELIFKAIDFCIAKLNKMNFNYVDKTLEQWKNKGIERIEDIPKLPKKDSNHGKESYKKNDKSRKSTFSDFEQREYEESFESLVFYKKDKGE